MSNEISNGLFLEHILAESDGEKTISLSEPFSALKLIESYFNKRDISSEFPIVNQDKILKKALRVLLTNYPYFVLEGGPGLGKSSILDFIIEILSGKKKIDDFKDRLSPEIIHSFDLLKKKAESIQKYNYLFVPNLNDPNQVEPFSYSDESSFKKDIEVANGFTTDIVNFFSNYVIENREQIRKELTLEEFELYVDSKINHMYFAMQDILWQEMSRSGLFESDRNPVPIVSSAFKSESGTTLRNLEIKLEFLENNNAKGKVPSYFSLARISGFNDSKGIAKKDIETHLPRSYLNRKVLKPSLESLIVEISHTDVEDLKHEDKIKIIKSKLNSLNEKVSQYFRDKHSKNPETPSSKILAEAKNKFNNVVSPTPRVSELTLEHILNTLGGIFERHSSSDASDNLKVWMNSVIDYFHKNKPVLEKRVRFLHSKLDEIEKTYAEAIMNKGVKVKKTLNSYLYLPSTVKAEYEKISKFKLNHGSYSYNLEDILKVNPLFNDFHSIGVNSVKIDNIDSNSVIGRIENDEKLPPHMRVKSLGDIAKGSILYIKDSFKSLIKLVRENKGISRENFLEYLQSGKLHIVVNGINYVFDMPRLIIGSDNENPFLFETNAGNMEIETGLEDRITRINVDSIIETSPEVINGSLSVIYKTLDKIKKEQGVDDLKLTSEVIDFVLRTAQITKNTTSLQYRELTKIIEDIANYSIINNNPHIDIEVLKQYVKQEKISGNLFRIVDKENESIGGYFQRSNSQRGFVYGLAVTKGNIGLLNGISSNLSGDLESSTEKPLRFSLVDRDSRLGDETQFKGFELAKAYLMNYLFEIEDKTLLKESFWRVSTHFYDSWNVVAGPSASVGITASLISAMSGREIYKNRFITGTLEPNGEVGSIGGTYVKGSAPTRLSEISLGDNSDGFYFLFPTQNLPDLRKDLIIDFLEMQKKITLLPVSTFKQAYHLLTEPVLTSDTVISSHELGSQKLSEDLVAINQNLIKYKI